MKIVSWNINGLRSGEGAFLTYMGREEPDIMFLQEVRAFPHQLSLFVSHLRGYKIFFNPSVKAGYSGTAVYYKNSITPRLVRHQFESDILSAEGRTIEMVIGNTHLFNLYAPNGTSGQTRLDYKLTYYAHLLKLVRDLLRKKRNVVLGGDLNIAHTEKDLFDPKNNTDNSGFLEAERKWVDELLTSGMVDTFRMFTQEAGYYTWWHFNDPKRERNKGWRFDYFLVSGEMRNKVRSATIEKDVFGSDHCPISLEVDI